MWAPEAAAGRPLAVVRNGDFIELDCFTGRLHLDIPDAELQERLATWQPPQGLLWDGGYRRMPSMYYRRTKAATSIFWLAVAARTCRAIPTEDRADRETPG